MASWLTGVSKESKRKAKRACATRRSAYEGCVRANGAQAQPACQWLKQDLVACEINTLVPSSSAATDLSYCRQTVGSGRPFNGRFDCTLEVRRCVRALAVRGIRDPAREAEKRALQNRRNGKH